MSPQQRQQLTSVGYSAIILVLLLLLIGSPFQLQQQQQHMKLMISGADATAFANQQQEIQRLQLYRKPVATRTFANFINSAAAARQRFQLMNQRLASRASSSRNNPSSVPLANAGNLYYYGQITLGTPAQTFNVNLDTGSADLWVVSAKSPTTTASGGTYNAAASSTYVANGTAYSIKYADGSQNFGFLSTDTLGIGGVSVVNQTFAEITTLSLSYLRSRYDSLMGLALPAATASGAIPPFQNMINQSLVSPSVFSFWLSSDTSGSTAGELTFGGQDANHYKGNITWVPITAQIYYWQFLVDSVEVCVKILSNQVCLGRQMLCSGGCKMIADTGAALIVGPTLAINKINSMIGSFITILGNPLISCKAPANAPNVTFTIGGTRFVMTSKDYIIPMTGYPICLSAFVAGGLNYPFWILGDAFIRTFYTSFDYDNKRIGFATAA